MRFFLRNFIWALSFFILTVSAQSAFAQTVEISGNPIREPDNPLYIDGMTMTVDILFSDLDTEAGIGVCVESKQNIAECILNKKIGVAQASNGNLGPYKVCGDGEDALKGNFNGVQGLDNYSCKVDGRDYFHEGFIYRLGLYVGAGNNKTSRLALAEFYVKHSYPGVKVEAQNQTGATPIKVTLWGTRPGGKNKNNYQIVVEGKDNNFKGKACVDVPEEKIPTFRIGAQSTAEIGNGAGSGVTAGMLATNLSSDLAKMIGPFPPGRYVVKINEQINENRSLTIGGVKFKSGGLINKECDGGFTYMHTPITISSKNDFKVGEIDFDPNESDALKEFGLLQHANAPCAKYNFAEERCDEVNTALGPIGVTPQGFIGRIFAFILTLAAFGSIIIIIYSGYVLITSAGNKEKIAGARETITSAVVGLLFIIFSLVILEIIGVDILRIPGLTR